jgi:hypothetical protein
MSRSSFVHSGPHLERLKRSLYTLKSKGLPQTLLETSEGRLLSYKEAICFINEQIKNGYVYLPVCDQINGSGECMGHKE